MTIAAHISFENDREAGFLFTSLIQLAAVRPDDHFIFFLPSAAVNNMALPANCTPVIVSPRIRNSLLLHYWYNYKLPGLLKRYGAAVFLGDHYTLCRSIVIPQYLVFSKPVFPLEKTNKYRRYLTRFLPSFIQAAKRLIVTEPFIAGNITTTHPEAGQKISIVKNGIDPVYLPVSWSRKEDFIQGFSEGKDYFLYIVNTITKPHLFAVVKAFSQFKKWQKSSIRLVLLAENSTAEGLIPHFNTYKYRQEVKVVQPQGTEHAAAIIAAAYGLIYLPLQYEAKNKGLYAMQSGVPVIALDTPYLQNMYTNAALLTEPNESAIAEKMMLLYKDENLRSACIRAGQALTAAYQWDRSAGQLWGILINDA